MEVPRLGGQIGAVAAGLRHSHSNGGSTSVTYITAHGKAGFLTHRARPETEPESPCILVGFVTAEPQREIQLGPDLFAESIRLQNGDDNTQFLVPCGEMVSLKIPQEGDSTQLKGTIIIQLENAFAGQVN